MAPAHAAPGLALIEIGPDGGAYDGTEMVVYSWDPADVASEPAEIRSYTLDMSGLPWNNDPGAWSRGPSAALDNWMPDGRRLASETARDVSAQFVVVPLGVDPRRSR